MFDVAVIGAGMAGLVCAQQLRLAGYQVVVVEKSRGLGGRVATRRLHGTIADHGTCYLKPKGELLKNFVQLLCDRGILHVWTDTVYEYSQTQLQLTHPSPRYAALEGMSAIAKFLAPGLDIWLNQRVEAIAPNLDRTCWHLTLDSNANTSLPRELTAKAVVMAIPAPQAFSLLQPTQVGLRADFLETLSSVQFDPCFSVIAGYPTMPQPPDWQAITFVDDADLGSIAFDSSKRNVAGETLVFVLQSSADFARRHLETNHLEKVGYQLLVKAAECLMPWLATPEWMQVHRWRYAFPSRSLPAAYLSAETTLPLVCCGDWCGGDRTESAMHSGIAAAEQINQLLYGRSLLGNDFLNFLVRAISNLD